DGQRGGRGGGEDEGTGAVLQVAAQDQVSGREASQGGEALAEGADQDIGDDFLLAAEASAGWAEDPGGVGLCGDQGSSSGAGDFGQVGERSDVAVHAEQAFGDQEAAAEG